MDYTKLNVCLGKYGVNDSCINLPKSHLLEPYLIISRLALTANHQTLSSSKSGKDYLSFRIHHVAKSMPMEKARDEKTQDIGGNRDI
jgi:hypothetical protein